MAQDSGSGLSGLKRTFPFRSPCVSLAAHRCLLEPAHTGLQRHLDSYLHVAPLLRLLLVFLGPRGRRGSPGLQFGVGGHSLRTLVLVKNQEAAVLGSARCRGPPRLQGSGIICPEGNGYDIFKIDIRGLFLRRKINILLRLHMTGSNIQVANN